MSSLKETWKETGKDLGHAFGGLGKTILKSAKHVVNKADEATDDNKETIANANPTAQSDNTDAPADNSNNA